jgi:sulfate transporter 4
LLHYLLAEECPAAFLPENLDKSDYDLCPDEYAQLAISVALASGIIQLAMSIFKLGFLVSFLSHPIISGFTSGAAIIIGLSQMKHMLGYNVPKSPYVYQMLIDIFSNIKETNLVTFSMGLFFLGVMVGLKKATAKYKKFSWAKPLGPLVICSVGIAVMSLTNLHDDHHVKIVGEIPSGLPPFQGFDFSKFSRIFSVAFTISIIAFMESIAISKSLASKNGYSIDSTQELLGLGMANLIGSAMSSYAVTGSFSRSAVNNATGCKSPLSGVITASTVLLTVVALTPVFKNLPKSVLSAIVISGVAGLVAYNEAIFLYKVKKVDCLLWFLAFLGTLFLGIEYGLALAVVVSLGFVIYESAIPHMPRLGRLPGTETYRSMKQYRNAEQVSGMAIIRINSPIYFANVRIIKDRLFEFQGADPDSKYAAMGGGSRIDYVILEMGAVSNVDSTAVHALEEINDDFSEKGVQLVLVNVNKRVNLIFARAKLTEHVGKEWFFTRVHDAIVYCEHHRASVGVNGDLGETFECGDGVVVELEQANGTSTYENEDHAVKRKVPVKTADIELVANLGSSSSTNESGRETSSLLEDGINNGEAEWMLWADDF